LAKDNLKELFPIWFILLFAIISIIGVRHIYKCELDFTNSELRSRNLTIANLTSDRNYLISKNSELEFKLLELQRVLKDTNAKK